MYSVLIVEDELFVRLGMKSCVQWDQYDMRVVGEAVNGAQAWQKIQELTPDILITDIRMPEISGIELIERIRSTPMDPYIIVITCLEDFTIAKQALSLGVQDYIIKSTMTEEEIEACLRKAFQTLQKSRLHLSVQNTDSGASLCNKAMDDYLSQTLSKDKCLSVLSRYNIHLTHRKLALALCHLDLVYDSEGHVIQVPAGNIDQTILDLLLNKSYSHSAAQHVFILHTGAILILMSYSLQSATDEVRDDCLAAYRRIHTDIEDYLNISCSFFIQLSEKGMDSLSAAYADCLSLLKSHYIWGIGCVQTCWDSDPEVKIADARLELLTASHWLSNLLTAQEMNDHSALVQALFDTVHSGLDEVICSLLQISQFLYSHFQPDMQAEKRNCDKKLVSALSLPDGIGALKIFLAELEQYYVQYKKPHVRKEIEAALKIIHENLHQANLSLGFVADQVGLSETYFSALFKQEMEQPFVKYLSNARIERAKSLLRQPSFKIFDVAIKSGFSDEAYFSRVFKKTTGTSPSEWRSL